MNISNKKHIVNLDFLRISFSIVIVFLILLWVYWPGLGVAYDFHDSFYTYMNEKETCSLHAQWSYFFYIGRPLYALINCFSVSDVINVLQDTVIIRVFSFLILVGSTLGIFFLIRYLQYDLISSIIVAVSLTTLPGMQIFINMTQASPVLWSIPFILLAIVCLILWVQCCSLNIDNHKNLLKSMWFLFLISVFLIISSLIYQQFSSLFFIFLCLICLSPRYSSFSNRVFFLFLFGVISYGIHGVLYLIVHNSFILPYALNLMGTTLDQAQGKPFDVVISSDPIGKIEFLFTDLLEKGLRLWSMSNRHPMIHVTIFLLPLSILFWSVALVSKAKSTILGISPMQVMGLGVGSLLVIFLSLILVNVPNLIAGSSSIAGRHVIAFQGMIIVIICIGIAQISEIYFVKKYAGKILGGVIFSFISVGLIQAKQNFDINMAGLAQKEIAYIRDALAPRMAELPERIVVIQPHVQSLALVDGLIDIDDESGKLTTHYPQDVPWIVLAVFLDLGGRRDQFPRVKAFSCCSSMPAFGSGDLVIDMRVFSQNILNERIGFYREYKFL